MGTLFRDPLTKFSLGALLKANDISAPVQRHLAKVYALLAYGTVVCAAGAATGIWAGHPLGVGAVLLTIGSLLWLSFAREKQGQRAVAFSSLSFFQGMGISALVDMALQMDQGIVLTAVLCTSVMFLSFSGFALLSKRRSLLYLGGLLATALNILFFTSLANMFLRTKLLLDLSLYGGLLMFAGYIIVDTQMIIERASSGTMFAHMDAAELFIDLVAVFVRVLIILMKNSEKDRKKKSSG